MNMQKVGIVVQSISVPAKTLNPRQYRALNMTRYTLCEYQRQAKRNSSRHSFAFYIPPVLRLTPSPVGDHVFCLSESRASFFGTGKSFLFRLLVTRSRSFHNVEFSTFTQKPNLTLFEACFTPSNPLNLFSMGLRPVFTSSNPLNLFSLWKILPRGRVREFSHRQAAGGFGDAP